MRTFSCVLQRADMSDRIVSNVITDMEHVNGLLLLQNLEILENAEANVRRKRPKLKHLNPFESLTENQFIQMFRLSKDLCRFVIESVRPFMRPKVRNTDLSVCRRVLIAVRFCASGSYQMDIGFNNYLAVSQSSVSRSLKEFTAAMNRPEIFNRWVKFPSTLEELNSARHGFFQKYNFPGVIGCIDCTHIAIFPPIINHPLNPEHLYVNRNRYHSINVQLIATSDLKIININARYPGSTHDAFIWQNSNVQRFMRNLHAQDHTDYFLLGDSGYPLRTWLLTPLELRPPNNTPEQRYNTSHKRVRSLIERVNGLLKIRFRCCSKYRVLHYAPDMASKIINTCAILHNLCIEYNVPEPVEDVELHELDFNFNAEENLEEQGVRRINPELAQGRAVRRMLIERRFRR